MATRLSTTKGRTRLPATERRAAIAAAAREVFCETGLRGARMRTIAERAGITEPLLYRHFSSREELFQVAVEEHFIGLLDDAAARAKALAADPDLDRGRRLTALNALYLQVMSDVAPLAAAALYEDTERGKALYQSAVRPRLRETATALYEATTGHGLPPGSENVVAVSLFGVHFGVALDAMLRGRQVQPDEMTRRITKLFA